MLKSLYDLINIKKRNVSATGNNNNYYGGLKYFTPYHAGIIDSDLYNIALYKRFSENRLTGIVGYCGESPLFLDLRDNPHMLVSGLTKSGKSVFVNTFILSLLLKNTPKQLQLFVCDPKLVDWIQYKDIPHCKKYATNEAQIIDTLKAAYNEMNKRNQLLQKERKKNIYDSSYNFSDIFILFDEVASYSNNKEINNLLCDIARMGRSAGVHLILITQHPTTKVINAQIKNNLSARICFRVSSAIASRTVLDIKGGENLRGNGHGIVRYSNGDLFEFQSIMVSSNQESFLIDIWERQKNGGFMLGNPTHQYFMQLNNRIN